MTAQRPLFILVALCNLAAVSAQAQPAASSADRAAAPVWNMPAAPRPAQALAASGTAPLRQTAVVASAARTSTTVDGQPRLLMLADGIVADPRVAPLPPPAAGFQYEH